MGIILALLVGVALGALVAIADVSASPAPVLVRELNAVPAVRARWLSDLACAAHRAFFTSRHDYSSSSLPSLWSTDDTLAGTIPVSGDPDGFWPLGTGGDRFFFVASAPGGGEGLWQNDGTAAGTALLPTDIANLYRAGEVHRRAHRDGWQRVLSRDGRRPRM